MKEKRKKCQNCNKKIIPKKVGKDNGVIPYYKAKPICSYCFNKVMGWSQRETKFTPIVYNEHTAKKKITKMTQREKIEEFSDFEYD